jgi:hypothetical protein
MGTLAEHGGTWGRIVSARELWVQAWFWLGTHALPAWSPWCLRRLALRQASEPVAALEPYLYVAAEFDGLADRLDDVPAGGLVQMPQYFVGQAIKIAGGLRCLFPLTPLYARRETAERERARLSVKHPGCAALGIVLQFDPQLAADRTALLATRRQAVRGDRP